MSLLRKLCSCDCRCRRRGPKVVDLSAQAPRDKLSGAHGVVPGTPTLTVVQPVKTVSEIATIPGQVSDGLPWTPATSLRIVHVTDVYTLENFPRLKTMLNEVKAEAARTGTRVVSVLTGDFLAPYLLSSIDHGKGMMQMLNQAPIDILTWGNHDGNDMPHRAVMDREKEFRGVWVNSNMTTHKSFAGSTCQTDKHLIHLASTDGSNERKVGMCAVLSDSPSLYKPGAFGGAKIEDPWETLKKYKAQLESDDKVDIVLPLCHLYEFQDERTCNEFDFPLILSGHDHHIVDRVINNTRLIKPGQDCRNACVIDITWDDAGAKSPRITCKNVAVTEYAPDADLAKKVEEAYSVVTKMQKTQLARFPVELRPLSSYGSRNRHCTMGTYLCNCFRDALNMHCPKGGALAVDTVVLKGANVRGGKDYADDEHFSYEALLSETQEEHVIHIFQVPGRCIRVGLRETWQTAGPGWMQYSDDIVVDEDGLVTHVGLDPIEDDRLYKVGSIKDLPRASDGPSIGNWLAENPECVPDPDIGAPSRALLMQFCVERTWVKIYAALGNDMGVISSQKVKQFDTDGDGQLTDKDLLGVLEDLIGYTTTEKELHFVQGLLAAVDVDGDGHLSTSEMEQHRQHLEDQVGCDPRKTCRFR